MADGILKKLRLKDGMRALVIGAPESYEGVLLDLPHGVTLDREPEGNYDFVHVFVTAASELAAHNLHSWLRPDAVLWVSYPKGRSIPTDLKRDVLWDLLLKRGLRAVSQVAIDETWSAMRFKQEADVTAS